MFHLNLNFSDPSQSSYYFPIIIGMTTILLIMNLLIVFLKEKRKQASDPNVSINTTLEPNVNYSMSLEGKKNYLKTKYLIAYIITRSAMWAKAPYLYTLFMTVHKFSMSEISVLYLVDAIAALIFGPITGQLADKYGRRFFCNCYNASIIINLLLRMEGSRTFAYLAQVVTGFGAGLICTTFEAWFVHESGKIFQGYQRELERYRKRLFKSTNEYDAYIAIITSAICAIVYSIMGIYAPFWISIILSALAWIFVGFTWEENKPLSESKDSLIDQFKEAMKEFEKIEVTCIGLIEGIALAILNIYLFSWTPILKSSTPGGMNVGFIFTNMVLTMVVGIKAYEVLIVICNLDKYISITGCIFLQGVLLLLTYFVNDFFFRMLFLALFNGLTGFYTPLNSFIKSKILKEKYRALLMNIFRIPLNTYVIVILLTLRHMNPFTIALIAGILTFVAFFIGIFLIIKTSPSEQNDINETKELKVDIENDQKPKKYIYTENEHEE